MITHEQEVTIALSTAQVEQVIRLAGNSGGGTSSSLLAVALDHAHRRDGSNGRLHEAAQRALAQALSDPQLSQSLLRGLAVLSCYGPERPWRAIIDLAKELHMSPSTTHRYVKTLRAVGLLEQHPRTREYRPVAL
jgi:hypothetical protein